jgi:hypothetical protein
MILHQPVFYVFSSYRDFFVEGKKSRRQALPQQTPIYFRDVLLKHYGGNSVNVAVGWQPFFLLFGIFGVEISAQISAILTGLFPCFSQSLLSD